MRSARCENCGALGSAASRCRYCHAVTSTSELVAAGFCDKRAEDDAFVVMDDAQGVSTRRPHANQVLVEVPPATDVGHAAVGFAWTRGQYVDLDVSVAIRFLADEAGLAAGIWLRSHAQRAIRIMITPKGDGVIQGDDRLQIATFRLRPALEPLVLRAKVVGDVLTVYGDGTPALSVRCPTDLAGGADLVIYVANDVRAGVVFEDACARLP